ncbi:MAG: hypothetical protein IPN96_12025 [Anaerolineales bacterium]|nr:hypothetical protein [Anaerolineales bacterium]
MKNYCCPPGGLPAAGLELVEQICGDENLMLDILDMLGHLVDKSLVAIKEEMGIHVIVSSKPSANMRVRAV